VNIHIDAIEHDDEIIFLHNVKYGPANQSYGLQVAQLAGVPKSVIHSARQRLALLEQQSHNEDAVQAEMPLFINENESSPAAEMLKEINPDDLTPKQALEIIYQLKKLEES
jgi:DNA mismatch repair protein MutS